jgi:hypothetical protein
MAPISPWRTIDPENTGSRGGQRLSGECRLIHLDRIALQQPRIGGYDVAQAHQNDVAWH